MSKKVLVNGKVLINKELIETNVLIENGIIKGIESVDLVTLEEGYEIIDAKGKIVVPGFIDIHTHGANGIDVNHASIEDLLALSDYYGTKGVTSYLPTLLTDEHKTMCTIVERISKAKREQTTGAQILGVHMEGPFLNTIYKGAMPEHLIQQSSIENLKQYEKASDDNIRYMTVSVENEGIAELIKYATSKGIVISLGHTGGDYHSCMTCIAAGANSATHLFNAMQPIHQHNPSIVGAALESDIYTEFICDGFHLHPGIVRLVVKTKGMERVIGVTDSIMAAGLKDGNYKLGVNDVVVKNGDASLVNGGNRAGSTLTMDRAISNIIKFTGKPIEECARLVSQNPATLLGIEDKKGTIAVGKDADIVLLNEDYTVFRTLAKGETIYQSN
ncbi:MAG TPA: N-acetylglucosamine-6-phosphate deacetylase [Epulopiscium sp.]|nr:N-acetylglucosamine-6-phosphate deacetylase [Candidatus Epulonipiscium sp.]